MKNFKKYNDLDSMTAKWAIGRIGIYTSPRPFSPKGENLEDEPIFLTSKDKKWK